MNKVDILEEWFTVQKIDEKTYVISEYHHWEETHCYLLIGAEKALLIDTGLGVGKIDEEVRKLTDKPIIAVATHIHWDHIGGHQYFPEFYVHKDELDWVQGHFPLPVQMVKNSILEASWLPESFDINQYEIFKGKPTRVLKDNDAIDIGGRMIQVFHTPGHSPGHMCFFEAATGYLFTGDLIYKGALLAFYPSTDPVAYFESVKRISQLPIQKILPGHFDLDISDRLIHNVIKAFEEIKEAGNLQHGSGKTDYQDFSIHL